MSNAKGEFIEKNKLIGKLQEFQEQLAILSIIQREHYNDDEFSRKTIDYIFNEIDVLIRKVKMTKGVSKHEVRNN